MSRTYIDVFCSFSSQQTIYHAHVWRSGHLVERVTQQRLADLADYCKQLGLPVVSNDSHLILRLYRHGINVHPPQMMAVGE